MGKTIFEFEDKFGVVSPFSNWVEEENLLIKERELKRVAEQHQGNTLSKTLNIVSSSLNSQGTELKSGETPLFLFSIKSSTLSGNRNFNWFITRYQTIAPKASFVINKKKQDIRSYAEIQKINQNKSLLTKAMPVFTLKDLNNFIDEAVKFVRKKEATGFSDGIKWDYFGHEDKFDWKHHKGKGFRMAYLEDVGVIETNHLGNIVYGRIAANLGQATQRTLYDGDWYQSNLPVSGLYWSTLDGIDDPLDSYALALGGLFSGPLTINSFSKIISFDKDVDAVWTAWDDNNTTSYEIKYNNGGIKTFKTSFDVD